MSIFISWRGSDRDVKNELVAHLRSALPQEEVWESDEGCTSNFSADFITKIRKSEIFVVIVSDESMKPSYVLNEVIEAHGLEFEGRLNMLVFKITDSPYTPAFSANLNHISDANHVAYIKGTKDGYASLASRISRLLEMRRNGEPENPYDAFVPEVKGTAVGQGFYVPNSRSEIFEKIDAALESSKAVFLSEFSGYGKKCAARQFAIEYAGKYKKAVYLHFFSGSLRDFFLSGIEFTNISGDLFSKKSEDEIILKKAALLSKLESDTLIIVPSLTIDSSDNRFVLDALATVGCRIIFVTETTSPEVRRAFPEIFVGRMSDRHLSELFFNYYEATEDEQATLSETLSDFFDCIDGHTRSVEIAATTIADEYAVYPEDLPEILGKIRPNSENSLSEKIFELCAELFDVTNFSSAEKDILLAASLFARSPVDEKEFVELLREAECFDQAALKKLVGRKWINADRAARTISIDNFLATVCYSKIGLNEELCGRLFAAVNNSFTFEVVDANHGRARTLLQQCKTFLEVIGLKEFSAFIAWTLRSYDEAFLGEGISNTLSPERIEEVATTVLPLIKRSFSDERLVNELCDFFEFAKSLFSSFSALDIGDLDVTKGGAEQFVSIIAGSDVGDLFASVTSRISSDALREIMEAFYSSLIGANLSRTALACEKLLKYMAENECEAEDDWELLTVIHTLADILAKACASRPYLSLRILRQWRSFENTFGMLSEVRSYDSYRLYLTTLYQLEKLDCEFDEIADLCFDRLDKAAKAGMFTKNEKAFEHIERLIISSTYISGLIRRSDGEKVLTQIRATEEYAAFSSDVFEVYITNMANLVNECANMCLAETAEEICSAVLSFTKKQSLDISEDARLCLEEIKEIKEALEINDVSGNFEDGEGEYLDYYRTFGEVSCDKKRFAVYERIAEKAKTIDLSALSDEELREKVTALKKRAASGEKKEDVAPEGFALVSEAGYRVLGYRHHYVQYIGGAAIADGKIAEILNGEGKTYTIILAAFLHFLYGRTVHIIDSSSYLTVRNYNWMRGVLSLLGCKVGCHSSLSQPLPEDFSECDILYEEHSAVVSAYMKNEFLAGAKLPPLDVAIVDEADELLIVNCVQNHSLISSEVIAKYASVAYEMFKMVYSLTEEEKKRCFSYNAHKDTLSLSNEIYEKWFAHCESNNIDTKAFSGNERNYLYVCIKALFFMKKGRDYFVRNGVVERESSKGSFVGFNEPYNFFLRLRERLQCTYDMINVNRPINEYIFKEFTENFGLLSGTTATARAMQKEFSELYGLDIVAIPPNERLRRIDNPPDIYTSNSARDCDLTSLIQEKHLSGQPVLVITSSVEESNKLSKKLSELGLEHTLLNAENKDEQADILGLAGCKGRITVTTALANRGVDIRLGGNPRSFARQQLIDIGFSEEEVENAIAGLGSDELRRKFLSLVAILSRRTEKERKELNELGGLCVIGASCFDELRTEQQLRGRSGRQGDNGESYILFSLEDNGLKKLFPEAIHKRFVDLFGSIDGSISSKQLIRRIEVARLTRQQHEYRNLSNKYALFYRPAARQEFLLLLSELRDNDCNIDSLIKHYYAEFPENVTAAFEYATDGKPCKSLSIKELVGDDKNAFASKKKVPEALYKKLAEHCENLPLHLLCEILAKLIGRAWGDYILLMNKEELSPVHQGDKLKKHLIRRSADISARLLSECVTETIDALFRLKNE